MMDLEAILDVMGCRTRRQILGLLTEEPHFVSQISRELEIGQKAIIEHLRAMEDLGILRSTTRKIERGRPRKYYNIPQDIEIKILISQNTIKMNFIDNEFPELFEIKEKIRVGKNVTQDLKNLIKKYDMAKKKAEQLLIELQK
jgi:ArsR family transcriptional regulator